LTEKIAKFGEGTRWQLPPGETNRQAIASLRGYVYQIHQTLSAWIALGKEDQLYVEVAEDFATIVREPERLNEVLTATQIKDTRESGSVTLNSSDVLEAIEHLFELQNANPGRVVRLTFLTTSSIGKERKQPLPSGRSGIALWQRANSDIDIEELRVALCLRFVNGELGEFLRSSSSGELRARILNPFTFTCGSGNWREVDSANRAALVAMRSDVQSTWDLAERAYDILFAEVFRTVLSASRMLTRERLLDCFKRATSISVPSQVFVDRLAQVSVNPTRTSVDENRLRELSRSLLEINAPPSMLALFIESPESARDALKRLSIVQRTLVRTQSPIPCRLREL
jgi:hypothetical protein